LTVPKKRDGGKTVEGRRGNKTAFVTGGVVGKMSWPQSKRRNEAERVN